VGGVKPKAVSWDETASYYAIMSTFNDYGPAQDLKHLYCYKILVLHQRKESFGSCTINFGRVHLSSKITLEEREMVFVAVQLGPYDFRCSVKPSEEMTDLETIEQDLFNELHSLQLVEIMRKVDSIFGEKYFALKDLPVEQRMSIVSAMAGDVLEKINASYEALYDENRRMNEIYKSMNLSVPLEVRMAAGFALERKLKAVIQEIAQHLYDEKKFPMVDRILEEAKSFKIELNKAHGTAFLSKELEGRIKRFSKNLEPENLRACLRLLKLAQRVRIPVSLRRSQDFLYGLFKKWAAHTSEDMAKVREHRELLAQLLTHLEMDPAHFLNFLAEEPQVH
jgi:hypothetical protein